MLKHHTLIALRDSFYLVFHNFNKKAGSVSSVILDFQGIHSTAITLNPVDTRKHMLDSDGIRGLCSLLEKKVYGSPSYLNRQPVTLADC